MSSHGDEKDAMSPDGDQRRSRIWHGVKIQGTGMSSDLVNEGSVKRKHNIPSRPSFITDAIFSSRLFGSRCYKWRKNSTHQM